LIDSTRTTTVILTTTVDILDPNTFVRVLTVCCRCFAGVVNTDEFQHMTGESGNRYLKQGVKKGKK
jgi:hypothetical protein